MGMSAYELSIWEVEAGGTRVWDQKGCEGREEKVKEGAIVHSCWEGKLVQPV